MHLLSALITILLSLNAVNGKDCEKLGLCSVGKVKPFVGDITTDTGLRTALEARSYKKELIIALSSYKKLVQFLQLYWNFNTLGYEHILLVSYDGPDCDNILKKAPYLGSCTWDTTLVPHLSGAFLLWHIRYRTLARVIRSGYNSWVLDTDIYFFHDPYTFLKAPPFSDYVIFHQAEAYYDQAHWSGCWAPNGGFMYVQNAKPDGPAAWYITEITHRPLREVQDGWKWMREHDVTNYCALLDQETENDILPSLYTGVPMWHITGTDCYKPANKTLEELVIKAERTTTQEQLKANGIFETVAVPPEWQPVVGADKMTFKYISMRMPNVANGDYLNKHGVNLFTPKGPLSDAFMSLLSRDCGGCPFWPDPEDPNMKEAAAKVPQERMMFVPPWFALSWYARGRYGYWDTTPVQQVAGHMNYNPTVPLDKNHKMIGLVGRGVWNWSAARDVWGGNIFMLNQGESMAMRMPLVTYAPSVPLHRCRSIYDFRKALLGLVQVASLAGRAVLWPDLPCSDTPWLHRTPGGDKSLPRQIHHFFFPWGGPQGRQNCMLWPLTYEDCSQHRRGMVGPEFVEYERMYGSDGSFKPSPANSVFGLVDPSQANGLEPLVSLSPQDVVKYMMDHKRADQPIIYLEHVVSVRMNEVRGDIELWRHWSNCDAFRDDVVKEIAGGMTSHPEMNSRHGGINEAGKLVLTT